MAEGPIGTEEADSRQPLAGQFPEPEATAPDPNRHWDGQRWLVWDGAAWLPETAGAGAKRGIKQGLIVLAALVVVALVLVGGLVVMDVVRANKSVVIPSTLGGLPKSTDATLVSAADRYRASVAQAVSGEKFDVGAYGSLSAGMVAFLVADRNGGAPEAFLNGMKSSGIDMSTPVVLGNDTCATGTTQPVTLCVRSSNGGPLVAVVRSGTDTAKTASMVDEAWNLQ